MGYLNDLIVRIQDVKRELQNEKSENRAVELTAHLRELQKELNVKWEHPCNNENYSKCSKGGM
jgi:hypothetical protein